MKVSQISTILNEVFQELIGESAVIAEDLHNIVDVGRTITGTTQWGDNFDNYVGKIIDKVGVTLWGTKTYAGTAPDIFKTGSEYGSILEKIRVDVGDYEDNNAWELTNPETLDFSHIFDFAPAEVTAKYYNNAVTFRLKISIPEYQVKGAFDSAAAMRRLFDHIEIRVRTKMQMAMDGLVKRTIAGLIAEKFNAHHGVVNLLEVYKRETGNTTLTAAKALTDKDFLRFASKEIGIVKGLMAEETMLYNNDGYMTHTAPGELKSVFLTDFAKALESSLYADTFHDQYVKQSGYSEVAFWQGVGTGAQYSERSKIWVKPPSNGSTTVFIPGVVAVLFDEQAAVVYNEQPTVKAINNPEGDFTNYWHKFKANYLVDAAENCVVFTIADWSPDMDETVNGSAAPSNWSSIYSQYVRVSGAGGTVANATSTWTAPNKNGAYYYKKV